MNILSFDSQCESRFAFASMIEKLTRERADRVLKEIAMREGWHIQKPPGGQPRIFANADSRYMLVDRVMQTVLDGNNFSLSIEDLAKKFQALENTPEQQEVIAAILRFKIED